MLHLHHDLLVMCPLTFVREIFMSQITDGHWTKNKYER